jgi:ferredoxin-thioredoxin reductase catalytic subunit
MADAIDEKALEETRARLRKGSEKYAEKAGYRLNPDSSVVDTIIAGLAKNKFKHGKAYCPCMFVSGNPEEDKKIICPCQVHHEDIARQGKCHCGLFVRSA